MLTTGWSFPNRRTCISLSLIARVRHTCRNFADFLTPGNLVNGRVYSPAPGALPQTIAVQSRAANASCFSTEQTLSLVEAVSVPFPVTFPLSFQ